MFLYRSINFSTYFEITKNNIQKSLTFLTRLWNFFNALLQNYRMFTTTFSFAYNSFERISHFNERNKLLWFIVTESKKRAKRWKQNARQQYTRRPIEPASSPSSTTLIRLKPPLVHYVNLYINGVPHLRYTTCITWAYYERKVPLA